MKYQFRLASSRLGPIDFQTFWGFGEGDEDFLGFIATRETEKF